MASNSSESSYVTVFCLSCGARPCDDCGACDCGKAFQPRTTRCRPCLRAQRTRHFRFYCWALDKIAEAGRDDPWRADWYVEALAQQCVEARRIVRKFKDRYGQRNAWICKIAHQTRQSPSLFLVSSLRDRAWIPQQNKKNKSKKNKE